MKNQEWIALVIVGITLLILLGSFVRRFVLPPLARFLLRTNHVKLAMQLRKLIPASKACSHCSDPANLD